jgi:hypothetical protein
MHAEPTTPAIEVGDRSRASLPDGRRPFHPALLDIDAKVRLNRFGLTELFSESHEPEFSELPVQKFKKRFPEGRYKFAGTTVEGEGEVTRGAECNGSKVR